MTTPPARTAPILLFNDECAVCRRIAAWVHASAGSPAGIIERPIGDDPVAIAQLHPGLDIWDAYETVHLLMPDGSLKTGGEAVAEVLRRLPNTVWFAWTFGVSVLGVRPFALLLDAGYTMLSEIRPLLGCESCGSTNVVVQTLGRGLRRISGRFGVPSHPHPPVHAASPRAARTVTPGSAR